MNRDREALIVVGLLCLATLLGACICLLVSR